MNKNDLPSDNADVKWELLMSYLPNLIHIAKRYMSPGLRERIDSDEMVNSMVKSILRMEVNGTLKVNVDSDDFLGYVIVILRNKIKKKARYYGAQKRDIGQTVSFDEIKIDLEDIHDPTDDDGKRFAQFLERLDQELSEDQRVVLDGKMNGLSNGEIAERLNGGQGMSTKAVTRRANEMKAIAERLLDSIE